MTRAALAEALRAARTSGWQRTAGRINGGWRVWTWTSTDLGVHVDVTEQARGLLRVHIGCTTTAGQDVTTGGFGPATPAQIVAVLGVLLPSTT